MKNAINYYYNLVTYDIRRFNKQYRFSVSDNEYLLCPCEYSLEELEEIYKLDLFLLQMNVYVHKIILNNNNQIITYINDEPYLLMQILVSDNRIINIDDILNFQNLPVYNYFPKLQKNNWRDFWIKKIDYFEYLFNELGIKYSFLSTSFNYFVGITETAISLLYKIENNDNLVISHRRVKHDSIIQDLYNPLNLVVDSKVRDISEYFKSCFINNKININDVKNYFNQVQLTQKELYLFFLRMLFPSFYFDLYINIIDDNLNQKEYDKVISKINDYQKLIKELYWYLKPYANLPDIEWIIKT